MRTAVVIGFLMAAGMGQPVEAQQWTPAEQEVITQLKQCWDRWMDGVRGGSPDVWLQTCTEPGFTYWGVEGAPGSAEALRRNWKAIAAQDLGWVDIRPLVIKITGDIAMVQFYGYWSAATPAGPTTAEWRRTEIFHRVNGRWLLTMGHSNPVAAKDLDAYKN